MPAASHPLSDTWATEAFKQIHSDLKSFPELSYHKYKYFIVFLDDYTSLAWVLLLCDKASAITALTAVFINVQKNTFLISPIKAHIMVHGPVAHGLTIIQLQCCVIVIHCSPHAL